MEDSFFNAIQGTDDAQKDDEFLNRFEDTANVSARRNEWAREEEEFRTTFGGGGGAEVLRDVVFENEPEAFVESPQNNPAQRYDSGATEKPPAVKSPLVLFTIIAASFALGVGMGVAGAVRVGGRRRR